MFTGLVREVGTVVAVDGGENGMRLRIDAPETARDAKVGDSIALAGVCLTVVAANGASLDFEAVPETVTRTSLGSLKVDAHINVEPSLRAGEPLGGHTVQGHVDAVGIVRSVEPEGDGKRIWVDAPADVLRYVVEKGSIAVDGVSLTIAGLDGEGFAVALIPHTLAETTLGELVTGESVNLEADVLAKYVEKLLKLEPE
jgi:riboflavin synthase